MDGIRVTLFVLLIMHILPVAITQLLILEYPFGERKNGRIIKWACTAANVLLNGLILYEILMYSKLDPMGFVNFSCSYQDVARLAASNIISLVFSVLIGVGIRMGVSRYYKEEYFFRFSSKCVLFLLFAAIPIILGYYYGHSGAVNLEIIEICRKTTVVDTAQGSWDEEVINDGLCYVVVVNHGILTYELGRMYLSDDMDELDQQSLRKITIKPGETYRHYMIGGDSLDIKKSGGSVVYLSDQFGNVIDMVEVPALTQNESYKSMEAGWQIVNLAEGIETVETITIAAPSFSQEGGFYDEAFELELTAGPGITIYYTLDSSNPTTESMEYSQPIYVYDRSGEANRYRSIRNVQPDYLNRSFTGDRLVDKCFVVRAVAVDSDGNFSDIVTKSYFINQDKYKNRTVLSLVSDPDGLFGDDGICVTGKAYDEWYEVAYANGTVDDSDAPAQNFNRKGIEWERESNLEAFENAGLLLNQPVGIRVQGGSARNNISYKRFSIYARKEYSFSEYFDVNLLNDFSQHSLYTRQGDLHAISQMIGQGRDVAMTDFIVVDVFLDGEFWYTTYLYEKFDEKNFSQKYNLSKDNVVIAKHAGALKVVNGLEKGKNPFSSLTAFIKEHDLSDDGNYLRYSEILDIQSYIDWACIQTFMQNVDYNEKANNLFWHTVVYENEEEGDTRWRLGLYDMDLIWNALNKAYGDIPYYEANPFTMNGSWQPGPITEWPIYSALRKNDLFCKQFVLTFMDLINTNFSVENTTAIMEKLGIRNNSYREFFEKRAKYVVPYMAEEFELTGTQEVVTLSANRSGTPVTLNTISPEFQPSDGAFLWTGSYFTDYPVTVTANAPNFSHWEVTANGRVQTFTDKTIEVPVPRGGVQIHAVFK